MRTFFVVSGRTAGGLLAGAALALSSVTHASTSIFGTPATSVPENRWYGFQSWATDTDGKPVSYGIRNKPSWATFDAKYGHLYGVPTTANVGVYKNITIYATDGVSSAYLPAFNITVTGTGSSSGSSGGTSGSGSSGSSGGTSGGSSGGSTKTGSATVHWTPPLANTNGTTLTNLAGYMIRYGTNSASLSSTVKVTNPGLTSYEIDGLPTGTYYFAVAAYNSSGQTSSLSNRASKTIQ